MLSISVGTQILIQVSEKTDSFNDEIRLAFIKRLQKLPTYVVMPKKPIMDEFGVVKIPTEDEKLISIYDNQIEYVLYILEWLCKSSFHQVDIQWHNKADFVYKEFEAIVEPGVHPLSSFISLADIHKILSVYE